MRSPRFFAATPAGAGGNCAAPGRIAGETSHHPTGAKSAGCIFKNPTSVPAGKLVDELGLEELRVGHARVSEVHGNFIVNDGGATAAEVLELIAKIQATARGQSAGSSWKPKCKSWGRKGERNERAPKKIAVLMGGPGSERDVSLATGRGVAKALRSLGAEVTEVDVQRRKFRIADAMSISPSSRSTELSAKTARSSRFWKNAACLHRRRRDGERTRFRQDSFEGEISKRRVSRHRTGR